MHTCTNCLVVVTRSASQLRFVDSWPKHRRCALCICSTLYFLDPLTFIVSSIQYYKLRKILLVALMVVVAYAILTAVMSSSVILLLEWLDSFKEAQIKHIYIRAVWWLIDQLDVHSCRIDRIYKALIVCLDVGLGIVLLDLHNWNASIVAGWARPLEEMACTSWLDTMSTISLLVTNVIALVSSVLQGQFLLERLAASGKVNH